MAQEHIQTAQAYFKQVSDDYGILQSFIHWVMCRIGLDPYADENEAIKNTINYWSQAQAISRLESLGLLLLRYGNFWLETKGDVTRAKALFQLAATWFEGYESHYNHIDAIKALLSCSKILGDFNGAEFYAEKLVDLYKLHLDKYIATPPSGFAILNDALLAQSDLINIYLGKRNSQRLLEQKAEIERLLNQIEQLGYTQNIVSANIEYAKTNIETIKVLAPLYQYHRAREKGLDDNGLQEAQTNLNLYKGFAVFKIINQIGILVESRKWGEAQAFLKKNIGDLLNPTPIPGLLTLLLPKKMRQDLEYNGLSAAMSCSIRVKDYQQASKYLSKLKHSFGDDWWRADDQTGNDWEQMGEEAEITVHLNCPNEARALFKKAIEALEYQRENTDLSDLKAAVSARINAQTLYVNAARNEFAQQDYDSGFAHLEMGRARVLLDLMVDISPDYSSPVKNWQFANTRLSQLKNQYANAQNNEQRTPLGATIEAQEEVIKQLREKIQSHTEEVFDMLTKGGDVLSLAETVKRLPENTLMLYYVFLDYQLTALAINAAGLQHFHQTTCDDRELSGAVWQLHRAFEKQENWSEKSLALSQQLIEPFNQWITEHENLLIVPYGALHQLPFQTLLHQNRPLGLQKNISYLPSASLLQFAKDPLPKTTQLNALIVGNPTGDLPGAAIEATSVATLLNQEALIGNVATRAKVLPLFSEANIIHLSTHGAVSEKSPYDSFVYLANDEKLTLMDFAEQKIKADLVVLSACETGRGDVTGGDDLVGLTRTLLAAGAKAVVVSLWRVNDFTTTLFMESFYKEIKNGKANAEALRIAQCIIAALTDDHYQQNVNRHLVINENLRGAMEDLDDGESDKIRDYSHPYFWSPFILVEL